MFDTLETTIPPEQIIEEDNPFPIIERLIAHNKVEAQNHLRPLLFMVGSDLEEKAGSILAYRGKESLKSIHRPIEESEFIYYGQKIKINGLDNSQKYLITEIVIGLIAIYDSEQTPVGIVNIHPNSVKWENDEQLTVQLQDITELEEITFCTNNDPRLTPEEITQFLLDYHKFFSDDANNSSSVWNLWSDFKGEADFNRGENKPNTNYLPVKTQIYLWRYLYKKGSLHTLQTAKDVTETLNVFKINAPWIIESLDGDHSLITSLKNTIQKLDQYLSKEARLYDSKNTEDTGQFFIIFKEIIKNSSQFFNRIVEADKFIPEITHVLTFDTNKQRLEAEQLVKSLLKDIVIEFTASLNNILLLDDQEQTTSKQADHIKKQQYIYEATFHYNESITSLSSIIFYIAHLYAKKPIEKSEFFPEETENITTAEGLFPKDKISHAMRKMEWLIKSMSNQSDESTEEVNQWLNNFYNHITQGENDDQSRDRSDDEKADVYDKGAKLYTDHDRATTIIANGLAALASQLPENYICAILGAGPGTVEEGIFKKAQEKNSKAKPGQTIAFDILPQDLNNRSQKMDHIRADTAHLPFPNESIDLMMAVGSPLNNMELLSVWAQYFKEITQKLSRNGYFIYEVGSLTPVKDINQRIKAARKFHQVDTTNPFGAIEILQEYLQPGDSSNDVGAMLLDHPIMDILAQLAGLELISPSQDPEKFAQMQQEVQNPDTLMNKDLETHNPLEQPFWITPNDPTNARAVYIFQKKNPPHPLFEMFTNHFTKNN